MTPQEFCLWLSGFFEISGSDITRKFNQEQIETIRKRLDSTFQEPSRTPTRLRDLTEEI